MDATVVQPYYPAMVATPRQGVSLTAARQATLAAVAQTILPHLDATQQARLTNSAKTRLHGAPPGIARDLCLSLDVLNSRMAWFLVTGRPVRFATLPPAAQAAGFAHWSVSFLPPARSVHQALRRFVLTTWYATPEAIADLGVHPPLHVRRALYPWEGPLRGSPSDSEPVAREAEPGEVVPGSMPAPRPVPRGVVRSVDFRAGPTISADVVVIGSGAGGAVAACRFAEAGREVVIVEDGDYLQAPDFSENEGEMVPRLFADQAMRTTADGSISLLQGGAVGGGSTVNWMLMLRPPEAVLDEWSRMSPGVSLADLAPHLDRVESEVHARMAPGDAHAPSNRAILEGARVLGWRARAAMINAKNCVQAGTCSLGCRYDAKQSALLTYLPRALAAGARLFAGASVERIEVIERAQAGATAPTKRVLATVRDAGTGAIRGPLTIEAPVVVLAAGAVGTPVVLQRSGFGGGGVGRYLRLHPTTAVMGHYGHQTYPLAGIPQTSLCDEFLQRDAHGYGFWIECPALQPALASAALPGFGAEHHGFMRALASTIAFIVLVRDGAGTTASTGSVRVGRTGRVRIDYRLTAADRANLSAGIEAAARLHLAAGAREAISVHTPVVRARDAASLPIMRGAPVAPNRVALFSAHVNGTCRLGTDPATSGCAPDGQRHGVRGLYVMDGSLLPTAPGVNPQETIMALASLLSERAIG